MSSCMYDSSIHGRLVGIDNDCLVVGVALELRVLDRKLEHHTLGSTVVADLVLERILRHTGGGQHV